MMPRRPRALLPVGALLAASIVAAPARASVEAIPVAGIMRIDANGIGGLVLDLPRTLDVTDMTLTPDPRTTFAYVAFAPSLASPQNCEPDEIAFMCIGHTILYVRAFDEPYVQASPVMLAGYVDVYVIADGPVHMEITFPGFAGSVHATADRQIDAALVHHEATCMTATCSGIYGGTSRYVNHGFAASFAVSKPPRDPLISRGWANRTSTCIYPDPFWSPNTPPYREGRQGCDTINFDDQADMENQAIAATSARTLEGRFNNAASGEIYTGFRAADLDPRAITSTGPESFLAGYGVWLEQGVR